MEETGLKKILVLKISAFESGTRNSHNPQQDNCHWQSMCYGTTLRFNISLREIFSKSASPRVMKNMMKVPSCRFYKSLGPFNMMTLKRCFLESGLTKFFTFVNIRNKVGLVIISFFKIFKI